MKLWEKLVIYQGNEANVGSVMQNSMEYETLISIFFAYRFLPKCGFFVVA